MIEILKPFLLAAGYLVAVTATMFLALTLVQLLLQRELP